MKHFIPRSLAIFFMLMLAGMGSLDASSKNQEGVVLENVKSQEEIRRRILTTVESAKKYQDLMDEQLRSLKTQNKDLHEKLMKLKEQFESVVTGAVKSAEKQQAGIDQNISASSAASIKNQKLEVFTQKPSAQISSSPSPSPSSFPSFSTPASSLKKPGVLKESAPAPVSLPVSNAQEPPPSSVPLATENAQLPVRNLAPGFVDRLKTALLDVKLMAGFCFLILLIAVWVISGRRSSLRAPSDGKSFVRNFYRPINEPKANKAVETKNLTAPVQQMLVPLVSVNQEGEYDYIGSVEAIPARIDLARMYREMGDLASAELVLKSVIVQGNEEQFFEAQTLLDEMRKQLEVIKK